MRPPHPRDKNSNNSQAFEHAKAELKAVFEEGRQVERQGKLDEDAAKRIEARLQTISERLERESSDELSKVGCDNATHPKSPWKMAPAVLFLLAFVGMPLEFTVGENFVFAYSTTYKSALPTLFALTLPVFAILWFRLERQQRALSYRYPTWAVRWLVMFPLIVVLSSSLVVTSPFGWSAVAGWIIGSHAQPRQAKVLAVDLVRKRVGKCDQKAILDIDGTQTNICLEGRVLGPSLKAGDTISVRGRSSFLGLFIEEICVDQPSNGTQQTNPNGSE